MQFFIVFFVIGASTLSLHAALHDHFVTTWKTDNPGTSGSSSITIPTAGLGYAYQVDWNNDGDFLDADETTVHTGSITHDFSTSGTYTIRIKGRFPRIYFNNSGDKEKILAVEQWGSIQWKSMGRAFFGAKNLLITATDTPDFSNVTDMQYMFNGATVANPDTTHWNTASVRNMRYMFARTAQAVPNTANWDTALVTNMSYMFYLAKKANPNTSNWNTAKVTSMRSMFRGALLAQPDTAHWNTAAVTDMALMFRDAPLANPDTSGWDLSQVNDLSYMFYKAISATPHTATWNTSAVSNMRNLFAWATAANPDTSNWDTSHVTNMQYMFYKAAAAKPDATQWDITKVTNMTAMLRDVTLSTPRYDAMLLAFNAQNIRSNVVFGGGNATYCSSEAARNNLITAHGWHITDGGRDCRPITPGNTPDLQESSDLGVSDSDNNTSDDTPVFDLECLRVGNTLTLYSNRPTDPTVIATHHCTTLSTVSVQASRLSFGLHTITYTDSNASDESLPSPPIQVNVYNNPPVATDNNYTIEEDTVLQGNVISDPIADNDMDAHTLQVISWSTPLHGLLDTHNDGSFTYTPSADFYGIDHFYYTLSDGNGGEATAQVTLNILARNDAPVITQGNYSEVTLSEDALPIPFSLTLHASDSDNDPLSWHITVPAAHGTAAVSALAESATLTYMPNPDYVGHDHFQVEVSDGTLSQIMNIALTIESVNDAPIARDDSAETYDNTALTIDVLSNDTDVDNDIISLTSVSSATYGTATIVGDVIVYTANSNVTATDTFTYSISDAHGGIATATVTVDVSAMDHDGVDESPGIDNNHNGNEDRFESHVVTQVFEHAFISLAAPQGSEFQNVHMNTSSVTAILDDATEIILPYGTVAFTLVNIADGERIEFALYYPKDERIEGYAKQLLDDSWQRIESTVVHTPTQTIVRFNITDGGIFDLDNITAQITDPGGAYYRAATPVAVPLSPFSSIAIALLLLFSSLKALRIIERKQR